MPLIRSAFSGEQLGFSYRGDGTQVPRDEYRMCLTISVQPRKAEALLGEVDGGTPQRFLWLPVDDSRISETFVPLKDRPPIYELDVSYGCPYPKVLQVPELAAEAIWAAHVRRQSGQGGALDGHAMLCRERAAQALAQLHGDDQIDETYWRLSGILADISERTRSWAAKESLAARKDGAKEAGAMSGVRALAAKESEAAEVETRNEETAEMVIERLKAHGPMKFYEMAGRINKTRRGPHLRGVIADMVAAEILTLSDGVYAQK